jgi:hypothetical protein
VIVRARLALNPPVILVRPAIDPYIRVQDFDE